MSEIKQINTGVAETRNEKFIRESKNKHGDLYDYYKTEFTNIHSKLEIICKDHGSFMQIANNHKNGKGCPKCGRLKNIKGVSDYHRKNKDDFSHITPPFGARIIPLSQGKYAIVDNEDYDRINQNCWYVLKSKTTSYATTNRSDMNNRMHRLILGITDSKIEIDHIDHNGLNNMKSNLRVCTSSENSMNMRKSKLGKSSKYKGVSFNKAKGKWQAMIGLNRKYTYLGYFYLEEDAAKAYDRKAIELFGNFACLNFTQKASTGT